MTTVDLGDVQFDPVATSDFRLSVEGTSNVGKSNTLAVILEDLADVHVPTLVVERLGALTPVRFEDEALIVVGARDEAGIDLPVALEDLDRVGEWVLDGGRKVLVDVSTYADYEADRSRVHLAAATALQSLNDRAHEKYRAGDRTKSLLVVDEAHMLAPKDAAPEPELDDYVRRCRGQLIKAATEGGNKGISTITAYQRRAFLHNGVIQLCEDFVAHRPGAEDVDRTADALRCSADLLADLATGEVVATGPTITGGDLVGPTTVRKRRSPDPREETFDLPDASGETEAFLEEIREEVEAERRRREQRQDELDRLRAENERLQERVDDLERELADTDRLASALENLGQAADAEAARDVGEGVSDLQTRVAELTSERDRLADQLDEVTAERDRARECVTDLECEVADLEAEIQELRAAIDGAADHVAGLADVLDVAGVDLATDPGPSGDADPGSDPDSSGDADPSSGPDLRAELARARDRIADLEAENERLREQGTAVDPDALLDEPAVAEAIDALAEQSRYADANTWDIVEALAMADGGLTTQEVLPLVDVGESSTREILRELTEAGVVDREKQGRATHYSLDRTALERRAKLARHREARESDADPGDQQSTDGGVAADGGGPESAGRGSR